MTILSKTTVVEETKIKTAKTTKEVKDNYKYIQHSKCFPLRVMGTSKHGHILAPLNFHYANYLLNSFISYANSLKISITN